MIKCKNFNKKKVRKQQEQRKGRTNKKVGGWEAFGKKHKLPVFIFCFLTNAAGQTPPLKTCDPPLVIY